MASDDEDVDVDGLVDELTQLQQLLGVNYRPGSSAVATGQGGAHAALAQEWADLDVLRSGAADDEAEPNLVADHDETLTAVEAGVIARALRDNRVLQRRLEAGVRSLERASLKLSSLRSAGEDVKQKHKGVRPGAVMAEVTGASRFWSVGGDTPEPNADTKRLLGAYKYLPHTFTTNTWTDAETRSLGKAVLTVVQEALLDRQLLGVGAAESSHADLSELNSKLQALTHESPEVKAAAKELAAQQWEKVQRLGGGKRSVSDCRTHWAAVIAANRGPWSADEHAALTRIAEHHHHHDWPAIAEELGTGRHVSACLSRYQQHGKAGAQRPKWDATEDERLAVAVKKHGRSWSIIAAEVGGGRTAQEALQRWSRRGVGVPIKKGRWDKDEDQALIKAVGREGLRWSMVAKHVAGRTDVQCRERYCNVLDPSLKTQLWEEEEDETLRQAVEQSKKDGGSVSWVAIANLLVGRTDSQCTRRWRKIRDGAGASAKPRQRRSAASAAGGKAADGGAAAKTTQAAGTKRKAAPAKKLAAKKETKRRKKMVVSDSESEESSEESESSEEEEAETESESESE